MDKKAPCRAMRENGSSERLPLRKELASLVEDAGAWVPVSVEIAQLFRSSVPERVVRHGGARGAECRCTLQGPKNPTLILQLVVSCRFETTIGDEIIFSFRGQRGATQLTDFCDHAERSCKRKECTQINCWRLVAASEMCSAHLGPVCVHSARTVEKGKHQSHTCRHSRRVLGSLCGVLCVYVDDQIYGGRGAFWKEAVKTPRASFPFRKWVTGSGEFTRSVLDQRANVSPSSVPVRVHEKTPQRPRSDETPSLTTVPPFRLTPTYQRIDEWLVGETRPDLLSSACRLPRSDRYAKPLRGSGLRCAAHNNCSSNHTFGPGTT